MMMGGEIELFIPTKENNTEISTAEFEQYAISALKRQFQAKETDSCSFTHNVQKDAYDGSYQIDGEIKLSTMGIEIDILVECKRYKGPIKREHIQTLHDKIRSVGAHKGIFITTSFFQSGALKYAKEHGIALISIIDGKLQYEARSEDWIINPVIPSWIEHRPFSMAMQTQMTETSISVSFIDDTDALYRFIIKSNDGDKL